MSFSFGTPKTDANSSGGFTFGATAGAGDAKSAAAKPIAFGTPQSATSFNLGGFGSTPAATTQSTGFSLGGTPSGLNLSTTAATSFNLSATPSSTGLMLGGASSTPATTGFSFGNTATTSAPPAFKLGGTSTSATTGLTSTAPASSGFGLLGAPKTTSTAAATAPATAVTGFSLGATPAAASTAATATALSLGTAATSGTNSFSFGNTATKTTTTSTVTSSFSLGTTKTTTSGFSLTAPTTALTTPSTALPATGNLNFGQLVDAINKWTIDLEEQGKLFSNQAKQLNAWDRLLVSNGEKVLSLNSGIERVKQQQQQLDQELDFVLAQQKELEDLITPLEKELSDIPLTDVDRLHTYQLAENMDTQLKQMSEDLKEIIEQLNETNKNQENSNPITQIRKILNAHMDSLQWIDRHTAKITGHLDQISKMHDLHRKSHEHSLKKTYD